MIKDLTPVKNCPPIGTGRLTSAVLSFVCPKQWEALKPTQDPKVRHCHWCGRNIELISDLDDLARARANDERHCVAVETEHMTIMGSHKLRRR
jgi:hypothetical protein